MSDRRYIEIPGVGTHELPPLLVRGAQSSGPDPMRDLVSRAAELVEAEDMIPGAVVDADKWAQLQQRKLDLALHLADQYVILMSQWHWGDSIIEWIRQCEITFETHDVLRAILHPDVWPHAGRSSFVELLAEKHVQTPGIKVEKAVGLRLTFRQPPPIDCFSDQFLFYLNSSVAGSAYHAWANLAEESPALLPPERFHFQVHQLN
jgi:hypothetical protein